MDTDLGAAVATGEMIVLAGSKSVGLDHQWIVINYWKGSNANINEWGK